MLQKMQKKWENFETLQLAVEYHSINKNQRFDQDQTSSSWEKCKKVKKIWKLWAAEYHSMNKNQSLIKIRPVVPEKNAKSEENFETLQLAAECHSINKNQSLIKMKPVVP